MENKNLYEVENLNGELVIPDLLDVDGNPVEVTVESEMDNAKLIGAGIALVGVAATAFVARKHIKKLFRATKEAAKSFKEEFSKEEEPVDFEEINIEEESEQ